MTIPFANPSAQFYSYQEEIEHAILKVIRGDRYILGAEVIAIENEFSSYIGTSSAIGVANGTDAIELALRSLDIKHGDEVITVSHTAVATVAAIELVGATPILVDIKDDFYTLDSSQLEEVYTANTKAVIAVHIYGQSADLDSISTFCDDHKIALIEDVSQAHGATWKGKRLGSIGDIGCFSCFPTKNLGAIGDAGLIATNDHDLAIKIKMLREYGWDANRISRLHGRNSRLDEVQAAILRVKLKYLDKDNSKRVSIANYYREHLSDLPILLPEIDQRSESVYHLFVIQVEKRNALLNYLKSNQVQAGIHYSVPVHQLPVYENRVQTADNMKVTERVVNNIISLPIFPELKVKDAEIVVTNIKSFFDLEQEL